MIIGPWCSSTPPAGCDCLCGGWMSVFMQHCVPVINIVITSAERVNQSVIMVSVILHFAFIFICFAVPKQQRESLDQQAKEKQTQSMA